MKSWVFVLAFVGIALVASQPAAAQIPNAGFETWVNTTTPGSWTTDNYPGYETISRSSSPHSGTYALQGQVINYFGTPFPPTVISIQFPVSQRNTVFSGYYKFTPVGGDMVGATIYMMKNGSPIGLGGGTDGTAYSSYTRVDIPIFYADSSTVPDSAWIEIFITGDTVTGEPHVGSAFSADDLTLSGTSAVKELPGLPHSFQLAQNYPNPFNPTTQIQFSLQEESHVVLTVYNIVGEEVMTLVNERRSAGNYVADFDASRLTSGVYFYRLEAASVTDPSRAFSQTKRMLVVK